MSHNTSEPASGKVPELTLNDLAIMIQRNATKDDIDDIVTARINSYQKQTNEKMDEIKQQVDTVSDLSNTNADRIDELQAMVESLKQEQLKNNICFSGVPADKIVNGNTEHLIIEIGKVLNVTLTGSQFTSYAVAGNKFIIAHFHNHKYKRELLMRVRAKQSLMVEEVFNVQSNSQIYLNDHLTPYFNGLHIAAREAKKQGKLATVSSYGGKVKVRKQVNEAPITITCLRQLHALTAPDCADKSAITSQHAECTIAPTTLKQKTHKGKEKEKYRQNNNTQRNNSRNSRTSAKNSNNENNAKSAATDKRRRAEEENGNEQRPKKGKKTTDGSSSPPQSDAHSLKAAT